MDNHMLVIICRESYVDKYVLLMMVVITSWDIPCHKQIVYIKYTFVYIYIYIYIHIERER